MERAETPQRNGWLRLGGFGGVCVALGVAVGCYWPRGAETPIWRELPAVARDRAQHSGPPATFADVVDRARPGIVTVRARVAIAGPAPAAAVPDSRPGEPRFGRPMLESEAGFRRGSGFLVNDDGLVVTSRHVVAGADAIEILLPQRGSCRGVVVGDDRATDLALVRLENPPAGLQALPLGPSEELRAGDWIVAVGNPYGFSQTVTAGVVSFVGRHLPHSDLAVTGDFLQISAPVNPGSSGCPVLDLQGRVVGVTTRAAVEAQGISFAVPSRTLKWTLAAMSQSADGVVRRGYLGIEFASRNEIDERGKPRHGAVIVQVVDGAPAHRAGIRRGDIVMAVDGAPIANAEVLHERIVRGQPGAHIALQVLRHGRLHDPIEAVLSEMGGKTPDHLN